MNPHDKGTELNIIQLIRTLSLGNYLTLKGLVMAIQDGVPISQEKMAELYTSFTVSTEQLFVVTEVLTTMLGMDPEVLRSPAEILAAAKEHAEQSCDVDAESQQTTDGFAQVVPSDDADAHPDVKELERMWQL